MILISYRPLFTMQATPEIHGDGASSGAAILGPVKDGAQATVSHGTPLGPDYGGAAVTANSQVKYCRRDLSKHFDQDTTSCNMIGEGSDRGNLDAQTKPDIDVSFNNLNFDDNLDRDDDIDSTMTESKDGDNEREDLESTGKMMDRTWVDNTDTEIKKKRQTAAEIWEQMKDTDKDWTEVLSAGAKRKLKERQIDEHKEENINIDDLDLFKGSKRSIGYDRRMRLKKAKLMREKEARDQDPLQQEVEDTYLSRESFSDIVRKKDRYMFDVKIRSTYTQEEQKISQEQLDNLDLQLLNAYMEHVQKYGDSFEYDAVAGFSKETGVGWLSAATKEMAEFIFNVSKKLEPEEKDDDIDTLEYYIYPAEERVYRNMWTTVHNKWRKYTQEQLSLMIRACNPLLKYKEEGVSKFFHFKVYEMGPSNPAGFFKLGLQVDERIINQLKNPKVMGRLRLGFGNMILHGSNIESEVKESIRQSIVDQIESVRRGVRAISMGPMTNRQ